MFERLFRRYGLPERIRTDNGQPFASNALGRLSTLSVWWVRLGIRPELIEPAHPEQNGRHERMHKTLKAATARPPQAHLAAQQRCFDHFRERYNTERPHEALGDETPASCYTPSPRPYRSRLAPLLYPGHYERRLVSRNGGVRWHARWVNVSHLFAELEIGFEEIDDGLWNVISDRCGSVGFMRPSVASSISSDDPYVAPATTTREGTTEKCYPSPEHNVLPVTWTIRDGKAPPALTRRADYGPRAKRAQSSVVAALVPPSRPLYEVQCPAKRYRGWPGHSGW